MINRMSRANHLHPVNPVQNQALFSTNTYHTFADELMISAD